MKKQFKFSVILVLGFLVHITSYAQIRLLDKVKDKANQRIEKKIDNAIDKGLDSLENAGKDKTKVDVKDEPENKANAGNSNSGKNTQTESKAMQTYSNYDFIPGEKIIFYDDFTETNVGDFPANWNTNASGEVVTTNLFPGHWFKMNSEGSVSLENGLTLPDNYTIEFDVIGSPAEANNTHFDFGFYLYGAENPKDLNEGGAVPGKGGIKMTFGDYRATYSAYDENGYTINGEKESAIMNEGEKYRLSFWVQKTRLRVYLNQQKVFDLPKVFKPDFRCNMARFELGSTCMPMITQFRIAAGLPDLRSKLITEGKLVSYGIYFDVNKDIVKPESYATLKGIAEVLNANPNVRIKIVGHTDADGADATNLDLSNRRAIAVKNELNKTFSINASRIETDGKGESQPVAPNDTPSNKSKNRRVEFLKL